LCAGVAKGVKEEKVEDVDKKKRVNSLFMLSWDNLSSSFRVWTSAEKKKNEVRLWSPADFSA